MASRSRCCKSEAPAVNRSVMVSRASSSPRVCFRPGHTKAYWTTEACSVFAPFSIGKGSDCTTGSVMGV